MMAERLDLQPTDKLLEVGTGSGYQAAVLSKLVKDVYTIEIIETLGRRSALTLQRLGCYNVHTQTGDGYAGWSKYAPFDKIIVNCAPETVPQPLIDQLKEGGRMVIPVGDRFQQTLYLLEKQQGKLVQHALEPTVFVPMTGAAQAVTEHDADADANLNGMLVNGGFEEPSRFADRPEGWYYVRQAKVTSGEDPPSGKHFLTISNTTPGRHAQALQLIRLDGGEVRRLDIDLWVRTVDVEAGQTIDHQAMVLVTFFDDESTRFGQAMLGPWSGNMPWTQQHGQFNVPRRARLAVIAIGLLGATGEISFDDVRSSTVAVQR